MLLQNQDSACGYKTRNISAINAFMAWNSEIYQSLVIKWPGH